MFRSLFRRQRSVRVPLEDAPVGHNVREVKIYRRAISKPSNFVTTFFVTYFFFRFLESYVFVDDGAKSKGKSPSNKSLSDKVENVPDQRDHQLSEHWKRAHESLQKSGHITTGGRSEDGSIRANGVPPDVIATITFPVWFREKKAGSLYQPDDPEYQDYVKIQSDPKKVSALKKHVQAMILRRLGNPVHANNLRYIGFQGQIGIELDLVPQLHHPPLYEVPALIVLRDGLILDWKALRPDLGSRMQFILNPSIAYNAGKASAETFFKTFWAIANAKVSGGRIPYIHDHQHRHNPHNKTSPTAVLSPKDLENDNQMPPVSQWPTNTQAMQELFRAIHDGQSTRTRHNELVKSLPFSVAVQAAAATFRNTQLVGQAYAQQKRARGAIQIRGTVLCVGEIGKYRMDVIAFYLPSEDKFLGPLNVNHAHVVQDYSKALKRVDEKKKELREKSNPSQVTSTTSVPQSHDESTSKPPTGKEKE